jgi:hypothetical protein
MRRSSDASFLAVVAVGLLAGPACAGPISGTFEGDATLTPTGTPGIFIQNFSGEGDDTVLGAFTALASSMIDFSHPPNITGSNGTLTETYSDGTLDGTSSGVGTASGSGTATLTVDVVFTGGTGTFRGATGEATITATITKTGPTTENITASYVGTLNLVPEPASLTLLGLGAVGLLGYGCRRRRQEAVA